jgi:hypothetical protein
MNDSAGDDMTSQTGCKHLLAFVSKSLIRLLAK